ncbi:MAG: 50S ribosomal protein L32e [Candidatus Bathyarchaeota archaeon]|nr:50S ribosomal protein L32e [Candidatus Bathyarchaeota archaeon]HER54631.1 50S ribosomal protein L32e [Candidatus Bathyarchaeota archaeon]
MTTEEREVNTSKSSKNAYVKNKKPKFRRQESWRYKRVTDRWRRPHGIDSKMRKKVKGWPASPTVGYQSPKATRGLHPSGYVETRVFNVEDLAGIDPEIQAVRVAHTVGAKKRFEIIATAEEKGIHVLNSRKTREDIEEKENGDED